MHMERRAHRAAKADHRLGYVRSNAEASLKKLDADAARN